MCIYGIELLADNIAECRANMLEMLADYLNLDETDDLYRAASNVLSQNIVHGDALTMRTSDGRADHLRASGDTSARASFSVAISASTSSRRCRRFAEEGTLFADLGKHEIFTPTKTYPPMTVSELACALGEHAEEAA